MHPVSGVGHPSLRRAVRVPRVVPLDAQRRVITGKLALNHGSVVGPALGIVRQNHDAVAGRLATDDEVARIIVQPPLPSMGRWTSSMPRPAPQASSSVDAPKRLPARVVEPEHVGEEAPVIGGGGQERPVAVKAGFRIAETALIHAEGSEDPVSGKRGDRHAGASFEVPLEQDEAFARSSPSAAPGGRRGSRGCPSWAPVRKPSGVSEHVAYRDLAEDGLIEVLDELERQVRDDLFHERRGVHHRHIAVDPNELPVAHNADRPAHASSRYAHDHHRARVLGPSESSSSLGISLAE